MEKHGFRYERAKHSKVNRDINAEMRMIVHGPLSKQHGGNNTKLAEVSRRIIISEISYNIHR